MYKVIVDFADLTDNRHFYKVGDTFPRQGLEVAKGRIAELSTKMNRRGKPLIAEVEDNPQDEDTRILPDKDENRQETDSVDKIPSQGKKTAKNAKSEAVKKPTAKRSTSTARKATKKNAD